MMKMSRLTEYACIVLMSLEQSEVPLSAEQISSHTGLEKPTVSKLLKMLKKSNLLDSQRGINGGYRLLLAIDEINLMQVISVIEGDTGLTDCVHNESACQHSKYCSISSGLKKVNDIIFNALAGISIAELKNDSHSLKLVIK